MILLFVIFLSLIRRNSLFGDCSIAVKSLIIGLVNQKYSNDESQCSIISIIAFKKCELRRNYIKYEIDAFTGM